MFKCLSLNQHTIHITIFNIFLSPNLNCNFKTIYDVFFVLFLFFLINLNVNSKRKENLSSVADINALSIER